MQGPVRSEYVKTLYKTCEITQKTPHSNGAYRNSKGITLQVKMTIILIILKSSNILLLQHFLIVVITDAPLISV